MIYLKGSYCAILSRDRRVRLPCSWREIFHDAEIRLVPATREGQPLIELLPEDELKARLREITDEMGEASDLEKLVAVREFLAGCRAVTPDVRGRVTLPREWCAAAGLVAGGEVTLAGRGLYCECWNHAYFETAQSLRHERLREIDAKSGIL